VLQRFAIAVLVLFVSSGAAAQISPCSGGPTNPLFTLIPGNPVQLKFEHLTIHALTAPTVSISGTQITVMQTPLDLPPPPVAASDLNCNSSTVTLGVLPPGTYNVAWNYALPSPIPNGAPIIVESHTFSFVIANVPALGRPMLLALLLLLGFLGMVTLRR